MPVPGDAEGEALARGAFRRGPAMRGVVVTLRRTDANLQALAHRS
jgi:hypothetical protein